MTIDTTERTFVDHIEALLTGSDAAGFRELGLEYSELGAPGSYHLCSRDRED